MATIKEDYVSFETAKLLKEKGFDEPCWSWYHNGNNTHTGTSRYCNSELKKYDFSKATLAHVMKWLREIHNINISVIPHSYKEDKPFDYEFIYWNGVKYHTPYDEKHPTYHELFGRTWKKYEQACEAAIKYCLENII